MSLIAFYDTETTGLPDFKVPSEAPHQPHIVDIAVILYDDEADQIVETFEAMVKPDGWVIPDDTAAIHGITTEIALAQGTHHESAALWSALELLDKGDTRLAHNESFDARLIRIALMRFGYIDFPGWDLLDADTKRAEADKFKAMPALCTMKLATPIMALPPTQAMIKSGKGKWKKNPNLQESHEYFLGEKFEGAHRAMTDAQACLRIYRVMKRDGHL